MLLFLRKPQLFFVICFYLDNVRFDNIAVSIFILFPLNGLQSLDFGHVKYQNRPTLANCLTHFNPMFHFYTP